MKRLVDPLSAGVAPIFSTDLTSIIQKNYLDVLSGQFTNLADGHREGVVISGCEVTPNGGNIDIATGIIFLDGEFYELTANPDYHWFPQEDTTTTTTTPPSTTPTETPFDPTLAIVAGAVGAAVVILVGGFVLLRQK